VWHWTLPGFRAQLYSGYGLLIISVRNWACIYSNAEWALWLCHCRRQQPLSSSLYFSHLLPSRCSQPPRHLQGFWQRWYAPFVCKIWHVHSYYNESGINLVLFYVYRQDVDCRCCRTLGWWEYLELRVGKWQEVGEIYIMGSFIILTAFQVFWGW